MTRSHHAKKEASRHMAARHSVAGQLKKAGHGQANWGSFDEDIMEGIAIAKSGDKVRNSASPAELGMAKVQLSSSPSGSSIKSTTSDSASDNASSDEA